MYKMPTLYATFFNYNLFDGNTDEIIRFMNHCLLSPVADLFGNSFTSSSAASSENVPRLRVAPSWFSKDLVFTKRQLLRIWCVSFSVGKKLWNLSLQCCISASKSFVEISNCRSKSINCKCCSLQKYSIHWTLTYILLTINTCTFLPIMVRKFKHLFINV